MVTTFHLPRSAAQMMQQARSDTGIDIIDDGIAESLEKYIEALNTEIGLHEQGAAALDRHLSFALRNRLRLLRDLRRHPEILEQPIEKPLIITGSARTGSTKLQKMLAASGDFNVQLCWQGLSFGLCSGDRNEDPAPRIREAQEHVDMFNTLAPKAKLAHEFSTFEPEEEGVILIQNLYAPYLFAFALTPNFIQWYFANRDPREDFRFLKRVLQYLQWQFHDGKGRRWVLKNPAYLGLETLVFDVFPDAAYFTTHREPLTTLSSGVSLLSNYHVAYSGVDRSATLPAMLMEGQAAGLDQHLANRDATPAMRFLDIAYRDVTGNAERVIEQVYAHAGLALSDRARQAMLAWERDNAQHKLGVHRHSLAEYGLTPEQVHQRFANYMSRCGALL